jgi:hypothetical protein
VLRKAVVLAVLVGCVFPSAAAARTSERIMPRVAYIHEARQVGGARVVFHVVVGPKPRPGGLYSLRPVLSNRRVSGTETVTSMQHRLMPRANVVGVNGDLFHWQTGHPSGILAQGGVLASRPIRGRSSLGIGLDGLLRIARIRYAGTFQVGSAPAHDLTEFNRPLYRSRGFTLFVPSWGANTPRRPKTNEAILADVGRTFPNRDLAARVVRRVRGSGHAIPAGGAVLQARGRARSLLRTEVARGATVTFRLGLDNWWDGVEAALGGGPRLVRGGAPISGSNEWGWFTSDQLYYRHPRTAVGQRADGRLILLVADGRSSHSAGLTMTQLANAMVRYGAENAMALDGGGSSELAFNGHVFNRPSDGHERSVAESLQLAYIGVYARKPRHAVFSPNGDGYQDVQRLYARFVRKSNVHLALVRPDGRVAWRYDALRKPGRIAKDWGGRRRMEGRWRWIASAVDLKGRSSRMVRRFRINKTLGFLTLSTNRMRVRRGVGGHLRIGFRVAHTADVRVTIRRRDGRLVRRLARQNDLAPGAYAVIWNGRNDAGRVVRSGTFVVLARGKNGLGTATLRRKVVVRRVP